MAFFMLQNVKRLEQYSFVHMTVFQSLLMFAITFVMNFPGREIGQQADFIKICMTLICQVFLIEGMDGIWKMLPSPLKQIRKAYNTFRSFIFTFNVKYLEGYAHIIPIVKRSFRFITSYNLMMWDEVAMYTWNSTMDFYGMFPF